MTDLQYKHCTRVTDKIKKYSIAYYFLDPVDPESAPGYKEMIKKPMDLGLVSEKLETRQYSSVSEWKNDVNQIWKNAMTYNAESELLYVIADELSRRFRELSETIPRTVDEEWTFKLRRIHKKFQRIMQTRPPEV